MADAFWSIFARRSVLAVLTVLSCLTLTLPAQAERYAAIVVDADSGEILHARHEDASRYPASLTKVMTLYLLFDAIESGQVSLDDIMTVSRNAAAQPPSNLRLRAGDTIRVEDAIHALVTKSANDVAVVVAEHLGGSERKFASLMTQKGRALGMTSTTFRNASGLPDTGQLTTARDLAILADALLRNHAGYYHYFSRQRFNWAGTTYENHNELIGTVAGVDGIKTGYTRASGFNLMTSAERDGRRVIAIMLGGASAKSRNEHVAELVETAFSALSQPGGLLQAENSADSFAVFAPPLNPNAAAEPLLNGQPLRAALASEEAGPRVQLRGRMEHIPVVEGDAGETMEPVLPAPVPAGEESLPPPAGNETISAYQARQTARAMARAGSGASLTRLTPR